MTIQTQLPKDTAVKLSMTKLTPFLELDGVTELVINRPNELFIERNGTWERHILEFSFNDAMSLAKAVAAYTDNDVSRLQPNLSATLSTGERIQCVLPPACTQGAIAIAIRVPSATRFTLDDYQKQGFFDHVTETVGVVETVGMLSPQDSKLKTLLLDKDYAQFMKKAVEFHKTIVVAGGTSSGKTTFMKMLIDLIAQHERIITIEDVHELELLAQNNFTHLFYPSEAGIDNAITPASQLRNCLRLNPDRILLAELRGGETFDFINVAGSGHDGSITSIHANSVTQAFDRMALMTLQNPRATTLPYEVILRLLYQTIDIVVHVGKGEHSFECFGRHLTGIYFDPTKK
ncbi:P-type DNA transfer ATPase VirB11 [Photobacterium damselae]|uniref:P-type DNA transfer ATPase VirB11 n=1 Tax=Photobacterium damselae TaxID=38293 RepID=UPI0040687BAB